MAKNIFQKFVDVVAPSFALKRKQAIDRNIRYDSSVDKVRRYEAASSGYRWDGWSDTDANSNVNQDTQNDLAFLRRRSRNLYQNDPFGKRTPSLIANNVVGTGIVATPVINGGNAKKNIVEDLKKKWDEWADKTTVDFSEKLNFYGIEHLVMRTVVLSGEAIVIRQRVPTKYNKIGIQIQVLESEYIDQSINQTPEIGGDYVWYGIKFNKWGKITGYYIFDKHPTEWGAKSNLIPIEDICHVFYIERTGQRRGVPWSASTLLKQRDLSDYEDAELYGKKSNSALTTFVTNTSPDKLTGNDDEPDDRFDSVTPGTVTYLKPGESVHFPTPPQNGVFPSYLQTQYRAIAAGLGITYESLTGDLSNVNFSSGRMGWIEMQRNIQDWQWQMLIPQFCDKVYSWFIEQHKMMGNIPNTLEVNATWTCPRREMIDPSKEITGLLKQLRSGLISYPEAVKQLGYDPDLLIAEIKQYRDLYKSDGLKAEWNIELDVAFAQIIAAAEAKKQTENNTKAPV
jgi:lambda family phage portal protein